MTIIDPSIVPGPSYNDAMIWWLEQQRDPAQLHRVALTWNWDRETRPLRYIVDRPDCDKGTALSIFYSAAPDYYASNTSHSGPFHDPNYKSRFSDPLPTPDDIWHIDEPIWLIRRIASNWAAGRYKTYRFYPNENAVFYLTDPRPGIRINPAKMPWPIPLDLCNAVPQGEKLSTEAFHDYPIELLNVFDKRPDIHP